MPALPGRSRARVIAAVRACAFSQSSVLSTQCFSARVVCAKRGDADDSACLDDVGREAFAVDAARVQAERARAAARPLGGPVAEERELLAAVDLVPRPAVAARAVFGERA